MGISSVLILDQLPSWCGQNLPVHSTLLAFGRDIPVWVFHSADDVIFPVLYFFLSLDDLIFFTQTVDEFKYL